MVLLMSRPRNRKSANRRRVPSPGSSRHRDGLTPAAAPDVADLSSIDASEELWSTLRQGARNVAGVSFQIAVACHVLVCGRTAALPWVQITPEGFEDIDCCDVEGRRAFVQVKEVGAGAGRLTAMDIADVLTHAAQAAVDEAPIILVTDGYLGSGLQFTGWEASLAHQGGQGIDDVAAHLSNRGMTADRAASIIERAHIVNLPWNVRSETERLIAQGLDAHPTVASLALSHLYNAVTLSSANQRATTAASAITHAAGDLDVIVRDIQEGPGRDGA